MKKKTYSLISNVWYIMREMFRMFKISRITLPVVILFGIAENIIMVWIPSRAVYVVENHLSAMDFVVRVGSIILVYIAVRMIQRLSQDHYYNTANFVRLCEFIPRLLEKNITTDYCNRESNGKQKQNGLGTMAISGNLQGVEQVMRVIPVLIRSFLGLVLFGGAIVTVDGRILLVLLAMLAGNVLTNRYARNYLKAHRGENSEIRRKGFYLRGRATDVVCGKDVRMYRMEKWFRDVLQSYVECGKKWQKRLEMRFYLPTMSDTVFIALRDGLAYIFLIRKALHGEISLAEFTLMLGVISNFSNWMFAFVGSVMDLLEANVQVSDYRVVLDMEDSFLHGEGQKVSKETLGKAPEIELRDVSFRYEEDGEDILSHIRLKIRAGEKIALVGGNGEGKTTLVKLLCGFYHPVSGEILVNGIRIEDYDIEEYFKLVGVVFQDVEALPFCIANIVSGKEKEDTDMERFWQALERAGLREKIESLPKREDTYITNILDDDGLRLSGGETQKLMLARCIYKEAPFLILDEPTSALDPLAESAMYEEYDKLTENRTSIFISHRLASTRFCDRILFLEHGKIIEEGTHEELLRKGGRYARIYEIQSHYYSGDNSEQNVLGMEASYE